jgi:hypothetical protein
MRLALSVDCVRCAALRTVRGCTGFTFFLYSLIIVRRSNQLLEPVTNCRFCSQKIEELAEYFLAVLSCVLPVKSRTCSRNGSLRVSYRLLHAVHLHPYRDSDE